MTHPRRSALPRRAALGLMLATPAAIGIVGAVSWRGDPEALLRQALDELPLPFSPARLELLRLEQADDRGRTRLKALVRLTWAPGMRQRGFDATGDTPDDALAILLDRIGTTFAAAA